MRRFATEKLRHWLRVVLHTQDSPQRTAFAFALGVFIACLPPVPWFHTLFALMIAFLFRLNRIAVLAGTYTNTPFTILPLIGLEVGVGQLILKGKLSGGLPRRLPHTGAGWKQAFIQLKPFVPPLLLGSVLVGLILSSIAYLVAVRIIIVARARRAHAMREAALDVPVPLEAPPVIRPAVDTPENPT